MEDNTVLYNEILKHGPSQTTLHIVLDRIKGEGRVHEVIQWCMVFLRVFPKDINLRMLLAGCYLDMELVGQAETEFLKVSSMMNDLLPVYAELAKVYVKQKRFKEAAGEAEKFLAHHPDDPEMHEILKMVKEGKDAAEEPDEKWPVLPDDEETLVNFATPTIAELYFNQGQLDAAVETYERVIEEHPDDSVSAERLSQLKAGLEADLPASTNEAHHDGVDAQKEKLLTILEKWLPRVGEIKYG